MAEVCRCAKHTRVHAAFSVRLNELALAGPPSASNLRPYVFKVGSLTNNYADRYGSINKDRPMTEEDGRSKDGQPRYAGVSDWRFLKCWMVPAQRHDDRRFKPWLRSAKVSHVAELGSYRVSTDVLIKGYRDHKDLFLMSEDYIRQRCPTHPNHTMHEDLLATVASAVTALMEAYVSWLSSQASADEVSGEPR